MKTDAEHLRELRQLGMTMRKAQWAYFSQVKANKANKLAWIDPMPLLKASKDAETAFDTKIKELIDLEAAATQPSLGFG